jgi:probable HAF family extracellular repeat protein
MNSKTWTRIIALALFAALAIPVQLAAQDRTQPQHQYHHYQLFDMGTLGGPNSFPPNPGILDINSRGLAIAEADTLIPDPYFPNCLQDCFVNHAITWQNGVQTDLGSLPGLNNSFPFWSNSQGTVVGISENSVVDPLTGYPEIIAVQWKHGKIFDLGTLGGNASYATAINNRGQVVGEALNTIPDSFATAFGGPAFPVATQFRAFLWQHGVMHDLGTLGGNDAGAHFVNERGQVAGASYTNTTPNPTTGIPTIDPFFWENGKMVDIGTLGGTIGYPNWMNNRGQVVGYSNQAGDKPPHAFLWDKKEGLTDLGTLGGIFSSANWINDAGEVVGWATTPLSVHPVQAFLWKNGVMTDLGTVDSDLCSQAYSINSQGQIVGGSYIDCGPDTHGFLSENGGPLVDLQTLIPSGSGVTVVLAVDINDRGEIEGFGILPNGDYHSVLLIPCDENHADVEGCDYSLVDASAAAQSPAPRHVPSGTQRLPQWRRSNRYHFPGLGASPRN